MPDEDPLASLENLREILKETAKDSADKAPDLPDEQTKEGIQEEKTEGKKARTAAHRADYLEDHLIEALREEIGRLASENEIKNSRIASLERSLDSFSAVKEELASLKSPHKLRKAIITGCAFLAAVGAILVSSYSQDSNETLLGLNAASLFGSGISFIFVSAVISLIMGLKG